MCRSAPSKLRRSSAARAFRKTCFRRFLSARRRSARVIDDPRVKGVSLTGSEPAGAQVAAQAGRQIKKTVLELGGSDPFIVMPSADLDRAVPRRRGSAHPQQRPVLHRRQAFHRGCARVYAEFERRFVAGMEALRVGDPMEESTQVGPLATPEILEGLDRQVRRSVVMGARLLTGGERARPARQLLRAHRAGGHPRGFAGVLRRAFRPRGRALPRRWH